MTAVDLCNRALAMIGESPNITAIAPPDGSAHAALCAQFYASTVDEVSEQRHWTFADKRAALAKVSLGTVTASSGTDVITATVAHGLTTNSPISFVLSGTALPAPLEEDTIYYAHTVTTLTFKVTDEIDGDAINLTTAGTGAWAVYKESDRDGSDFMYALPTDCLVERYLLPAGSPDGWPGQDGALWGTPYSGIGVVTSASNGLNYSNSLPEFGGIRMIPAKRALNAGGEQVIYTNLEDAQLLYTSYIDDVTQWPPLFKNAVVFRLAAYLAGAIKRDNKLVDWCLGMAQMTLSEAARVDASRVIEQEPRRYPWRR